MFGLRTCLPGWFTAGIDGTGPQRSGQ